MLQDTAVMSPVLSHLVTALNSLLQPCPSVKVHLSFLLLHSDHHCGVGASQPLRIHLSGAMGRAAGSAVLSYLLGGADDGVGQHHGLADSCSGTLCLWPGHGQPAFGQTQRTEREEAERTR